jgi:Acyltransferase C-terminus
MWDTLRLPNLTKDAGYKFHVHSRRFPIETLPERDEDLSQWLETLWVEKGEWLDIKKSEWEETRLA